MNERNESIEYFQRLCTSLFCVTWNEKQITASQMKKHPFIIYKCCSVGAQLYIPRLLEIAARRPVYVRLALWFLQHPAWMESHMGGSRLTPTVHPCWLRSGGCGWPMYCMSPMNHRNTRNPHMFDFKFHKIRDEILNPKMTWIWWSNDHQTNVLWSMHRTLDVVELSVQRLSNVVVILTDVFRIGH